MKTPEMEQVNIPIEKAEIKGLSLRVAISILISLATLLIAGTMWYSEMMSAKKAADERMNKIEQEFAAYKLLQATEGKTKDADINALKLKVNTIETLQKLK
jgi:hypothetical protein